MLCNKTTLKCCAITRICSLSVLTIIIVIVIISTLIIGNPEGFKKLRYAMQTSWNGWQSSLRASLSCSKITYYYYDYYYCTTATILSVSVYMCVVSVCGLCSC